MKLSLSKKEKISLFLVLLGGTFLFLTGIFSHLYLGDETFHYRFASRIYHTKSRPLYDPLAGYSEQGKIRYITEPLWHTGLAVAWTVSGGVSQITAQFYHVLYFVSLLAGTYLLAKEMYDSKRALYSMLLVGSVPLLVALSIILHLDMPVTALITFCFLMLIKAKYVWAGLFLGLSFLTKRNALFLFPVIIGYICFGSKEPLKQKLMHLLLLGAVFALVTFPDLYFRTNFFGLDSLVHNVPQNWGVRSIRNFSKFAYPSKFMPYDSSNILYGPRVLLRDFGPLLLALVGVFLLQNLLQKKYNRKDCLLLCTVLSYTFFSIFFFWPVLSLRYFLPIIPFLAILGSGSLILIKRKWLRYALIFACIAQFSVAASYTFLQRRIPPAVKQAYEFIRENTPADARIMCTKNALALHAERVTMWESYASLVEMPYLLWSADEKEVLEILGRYKIGYIFVEKDRIYDDQKISHLGGYPKSFVNKVSSFDSLKLVFENEAVSIWKITQSP